MSTTATPTPKPAPWRELFETHLNQNQSTEFTLSTITYSPQNRPLPRARICGFRGFFPNPSLHPTATTALNEQDGGLNPTVWESDMITFTTDVRMEKVGQIEREENVEAVFWLKEVGSQWRVKGGAFVVGGEEGMEERARGEIGKGMRRVDGGGDRGDGSGWSWEKQVTSYFANHTPVLRGSFKSPSPGQPKPADANVKPGKVEDIHDSIARKNFRVVVIRPEEVEQLDLADYENPGRRKWTVDGRGEWEEVELWP